ncbi:hypothetical protein O6H91_15G055600 [Diphasiastrum complanatum]|uniref:Uncharacterized protein n=1 Tax=Diphasiastrum complanatum TaxID=34168 RepID=A0ACC2BIK6_DIPCM|nr:hypothetical protein O6H91_15G055600 [Diphasiastrum complanatum]
MGSLGNDGSLTPTKRKFCERCWKAASVCICKLVKRVVDNAIGVTILQHPAEKDHPLGSARIAMLGLKNVKIVPVTEVQLQDSCRLRAKVPGSKRCIAGRGGKNVQHFQQKDGSSDADAKILESETVCKFGSDQQLVESWEAHDDVFKEDRGHKLLEDKQNADKFKIPSWIKLPHGACLLYPSEKAMDLMLIAPNANANSDLETKHPRHLIVLDGTWSKAKRLYYDNPWLHQLPHYQLPLQVPSLYAGVRREPKPGCLSTIESIVYALRLLEPQTQGLELLLEVFDSMISIQRRYADEKAKQV